MAFSGTPQGRVFGWAGRLIQYVKRQMTRTASLVALALLLGNPVLAATPRPKGANCSLAAPPSDAGEEFNHGVTLRVFPRVRDIHDSYNGCQNLWAPNGAGWEIISITEVLAGDPIRVWLPYAPEAALACRYKRGQVVVGNPEACPMAKHLLVRSRAPGCVEKMKAAVAAHGIGGIN